MKKITAAVFLALLTVAAAGCTAHDRLKSDSSPQISGRQVNSTDSSRGTDGLRQGEKRITMNVNGEEVVIVLNDSREADLFYNSLPLELNFEDYNDTEKISYLPEDVFSPERTESFDPDVGDVCFYAPWGNLSVFYKDFRLSEGLVPLGHIESGLGALTAAQEDFSAVLTAVK